MGSPDPRQIDGIGGADPLTSKVAILAPASRPDADVDYLFLQVFVDRPIVTDAQPCGNILAGVGPAAIERGLVPVGGRRHAGPHPHAEHRRGGDRPRRHARRPRRLRRATARSTASPAPPPPCR